MNSLEPAASLVGTEVYRAQIFEESWIRMTEEDMVELQTYIDCVLYTPPAGY